MIFLESKTVEFRSPIEVFTGYGPNGDIRGIKMVSITKKIVGTTIRKPNDQSVDKQSNTHCPECAAGDMKWDGGCATCYSCGWSMCEK